MWYFHICRGCRGRRNRDSHYCRRSPDEGLNTTFWPNRPPRHAKNPCLHLIYTGTQVRGGHARMYNESTHSQSEKCADNWGALSSGLERRETGHSLSLCLSWGVARRSCGAKRETVEFLSYPMGHTAKYENHKYLASSNRFRILCYVKTKTAMFVAMSALCIYFSISNFKLDITATFSCIRYDNNLLWNLFCIEKCTVLYFGEAK